ncbi:hypothetical protein, partial [Streptomyces rameus]|uniref:hypothetical protein n=1 Tax=Streptomyces rameus TaxID=68261 RepID=UPI0031EC910E
MTSSLIRGRPRRATAHIRMRVAHAVLGALAGAGWLVSPVMTAGTHDPVPAAPVGAVVSAAAPAQDGTSTADLVLPLVAGVAAVALAGYGYVRRTRRTRTRTTPGTVSAHPPGATAADSERQARAALRLADDCVRASREELDFVREAFGEKRTEPFAHALRAAETELAAAFAIWRRYEGGVPEEPSARRQALVGVIGRCAEAGRRLDAEAVALDLVRGFDTRGAGGRATPGPGAPGYGHPADEADAEATQEAAGAGRGAVRDLSGGRAGTAQDMTGGQTGTAQGASDGQTGATQEALGAGTGAGQGTVGGETGAAQEAAGAGGGAVEEGVGGGGGGVRAAAEGAGRAVREGDGAGVCVALEVAEGRFRELAARVVAARHTLVALRERYAPSATGAVTGYVEQAQDRLLFATASINEARQAA